MSQDVTAVLKFAVDDDTAKGLSSANRNLKKNERAIQRVIEQQKKLTREAGKSADQIAIETLKRSDAKDEVIAQVMALQKERQAILDAKSARTESINEVDKMIAAMKEQAATIGMTNSELAVYKATQKGATAEQLATIQATQAEIEAKQRASTATVKQANSAEQMIQKLQQEIDLFGKSDDQILAYKLALDGATQAQIDEVMAMRAKMAAMNRSLPLMQRMKQQLRFIRGGFGQVGHQVQDIAVQLQGGTDAMIVFGQQGSQIASLFGPGGAAIGALLAVGAAAFTVFKNFELTTNEVEEMRREFEEFQPKTDAARESLDKTLALLTQTERNNLREQIAEVNEEFEDAVSKGFLAIERYKQIGSVLADAPKADLIQTIRSAGVEAQTAETRLFTLRDELVQLGGAVTDFPTDEFLEKVRNLFAEPLFGGREVDAPTPDVDTSAATDALQDFESLERAALRGVKAIESKYALLEKTIRDTATAAGVEGQRLTALLSANDAFRQAEIDKFNEETAQKERDLFTAAMKRYIEHGKQKIAEQQREKEEQTALRDETLAALEAHFQAEQDMREGNLAHMLDVIAREDEATAESARKREALSKARTQMDMQVLGSAQSLAQGIMSAMNKESGAYKAIFAASQALAIAQTIINTEMAAAAALAPPPVGVGPIAGVGYAKVIRGLGYASVGLIAAQTAASFEGGGFTGRGARSGGVDGKGGFPAILHPNETVIDHEGGGMQPVVVNQTINVTTGVQQTVRAEIANLLPQISEAAKSAVADSRMRGGTYGTSMGA